MILKKLGYPILFLFLFASSLSAQTYREFIALHELHQKTNGAQWDKTWDLKTPIGSWEGVTVKNGHVVALDLSNNNLEGELPMTLVNLKHLKKLNLSGNKLTGKLPNGIGRLSQLQGLSISDNGFTGSIPKGFSKLSQLKFLKLANNDFDDYKGLNEIQNNQLLAFDMMNQFKELNLMDMDANRRLANSKFEDIEE